MSLVDMHLAISIGLTNYHSTQQMCITKCYIGINYKYTNRMYMTCVSLVAEYTEQRQDISKTRGEHVVGSRVNTKAGGMTGQTSKSMQWTGQGSSDDVAQRKEDA